MNQTTRRCNKGPDEIDMKTQQLQIRDAHPKLWFLKHMARVRTFSEESTSSTPQQYKVTALLHAEPTIKSLNIYLINRSPWSQ